MGYRDDRGDIVKGPEDLVPGEWYLVVDSRAIDDLLLIRVWHTFNGLGAGYVSYLESVNISAGLPSTTRTLGDKEFHRNGRTFHAATTEQIKVASNIRASASFNI